jgi:hypothetical protein
MSAAKVNIQEIDLSTRVPSFPGVTGAMVIPALKGPVGVPFFVTSDTQLLEVFTPDRRVDVGMSLAFYSALAYLEKSDKLWVIRAVNGALHGGLSLKTAASPYSNFAYSAGLADPTAYVFDGMPDVEEVAQEVELTFEEDASFYDVAGAAKHFSLYTGANARHYFWLSLSDGANTQTDPAPGGTGHQVTILAADDAEAIAAKAEAVIAALTTLFTSSVAAAVVTATNVDAGAATAPVVASSGVSAEVTVLGVTEVDQTDECVALFGSSPGAWNDDVGVKVITDPDLVKEADAFIIEVYKSSNESVPVETWTVSRVSGALDGFGDNMFIEDRLQGSNYIRGYSNPAVAGTTLPKAQASILYMGGGSDGSAVSDSHMTAALDLLANPDDIFFTLLMDGGWATPAMGLAMDSIVSGRGDSVALNSTPLSDEASATYINDILEYRKEELNLNSSYSALYTPHVKIQDKFNDRVLFIAPDGYAGAAISASASNFEIWFPPAGNKRGVVNVLDLRRRFSSGELDVLSDAQINCLKFTPGKGIRIWGQSTLKSSPSKLQELNVRLLLITVEPAVKEALEDFLFDLNDASTRSQAAGVVDAFMEDIQARRGVSAYRVVCDTSNNTSQDIASGRMKLDLFLIPTGAVKEIQCRVIITNEGVDFASLTV